MAFGRRRAAPRTTVTKTTTKPGILGRLTGGRTRKTTTTTRPAVKRSRFGRTYAAPRTRAAPRRKTSIGDKVSGAMMRLRGSLTRKPAVKAAGTRRMHGTDGRGTRRVY